MVCTAPIRGKYRPNPWKGYRSLASHYNYRQPHTCGCLFLAYWFLLPVNGSVYSFMLIWSLAQSSSNWFFIYSAMIFCFFQPYQRNTLDTKNLLIHTCISNLHVDRRSLDYFSPWDIPWIVLYLNVAGYLRAYGCDPGTPLPLWSPLLFAHTNFSGFLQYLFWLSHISLSFYTLGQRLCGIVICICCGLCFWSRHSLFSLINLLLFCNAVPNHLHYTWRFNSLQWTCMKLALFIVRSARFTAPPVELGGYFDYQ